MRAVFPLLSTFPVRECRYLTRMLGQTPSDTVKAATILGGSIILSTILAGAFFSPIPEIRDIIGVLVLLTIFGIILKRILSGGKAESSSSDALLMRRLQVRVLSGVLYSSSLSILPPLASRFTALVSTLASALRKKRSLSPLSSIPNFQLLTFNF